MTIGDNTDDSGSASDPDFWAIRNSLLPATPDMEQAADLLGAAADMVLADRDEDAAALIRQADITDLFDLREQACRTPPVFNVHRLRTVANLLPIIPKEQRDKPFKSDSPLGEAVFRRDGWRCRYCGCRTIPAKVRRWMDQYLPDTIRWDKHRDSGCHSGFWALWASADHVIPHSLGGRNTQENLVTACVVCQFARGNYTLEQMGIADPRDRLPVLDGWDGLTRLIANATTRTPLASAKPRTQPPQSDRVSAGEAVLANERSKLTARTPLLSPSEYYARIESRLPNLAQPLETFLAGLADIGVAVEVVRSAVLRFSISAEQRVSAGAIKTDGRVDCMDAYYYARKHDHSEIGERYLGAVAVLGGGVVRSAGRDVPEVFGPGGRQINVADLLPNAKLWKIAVANFVREMKATARK